MGQAALVRVKEMQGWDRYGQRTVDIINELDRKQRQ